MTALKIILIYLAKKYAAEFFFNHVIEALEVASKNTKTVIDDDAVAKIKVEKDFIISVINGRVK